MAEERRWIGWVGVFGSAVLAWWLTRSHEEPPKDPFPGWPWPTYRFLRNPGMALELEMTPEQVHQLWSSQPLTDWTDEEKKQYGYHPNNDWPEQRLRAARVMASFTAAQQRRYVELELQDMDTLAAEIPAYADKMELSDLQRQKVRNIAQDFAGRRLKICNGWSLEGASVAYAAPLEVTADLEREQLRHLLLPDQRDKLEALKGKPGMVFRTSEEWQVQYPTAALLACLRNPQIVAQLGLNPQLVAKTLEDAKKQASWLSADGPDAAIIPAVRAWALLNDGQKTRWLKLSIPYLWLSAAVLRKDCATLLGMDDHDRDRIATVFANMQKARQDDSFFRSSIQTPAMDVNIDRLLWTMLSEDLKKKWASLGGRVPVVR